MSWQHLHFCYLSILTKLCMFSKKKCIHPLYNNVIQYIRQYCYTADFCLTLAVVLNKDKS